MDVAWFREDFVVCGSGDGVVEREEMRMMAMSCWDVVIAGERAFDCKMSGESIDQSGDGDIEGRGWHSWVINRLGCHCHVR